MTFLLGLLAFIAWAGHGFGDSVSDLADQKFVLLVKMVTTDGMANPAMLWLMLCYISNEWYSNCLLNSYRGRSNAAMIKTWINLRISMITR